MRQLLIQLNKLESKQFFPLLGVAVIVLLAVDIFLIARPQLGVIAGLAAKTAQLRSDIDTLQVNKQRMGQMRLRLEGARREARDFKAMVRKVDEVPAVLKVISTLANQYGVKIDQLVPQKSDGVVIVKNEEGEYTGLSILVKARSGYHDLGRFLNRLEQEKVFWQIDSLDILADGPGLTRHAVKMQIKILILGGR